MSLVKCLDTSLLLPQKDVSSLFAPCPGSIVFGEIGAGKTKSSRRTLSKADAGPNGRCLQGSPTKPKTVRKEARYVIR